VTRAKSRRAEAALTRQVHRALLGLRESVQVGQLQDAFLARRIELALTARLALAKATVRKTFLDGFNEAYAQAWRNR